MFCAKHTYAALRPFSLLVDDKDFDFKPKCCSESEQDILVNLTTGSSGLIASTERDLESESISKAKNFSNKNATYSSGGLFTSQSECVAFAQNDAIAPVPAAVAKSNSIIDLVDVDGRLFYSVDFGPNYASIGEMIEAHSVYLPKARQKGCEDWRLLPYPVAGEVNGLPMFRGLAVATNGVHVAIETSNGALIFGHVGWFVVDKEEGEEKCRDVKVLFAPVADTKFKLSSTVKQQLNELESLFSL